MNGDRKMESNDSPEIPDRDLTSDIPNLLFGLLMQTNFTAKLSSEC